MIKLSDAVKTLRKALKKDKGFYISWQANIAIQFFDEFSRIKVYPNRKIIKEVSLKSAKRFLDLLIK